MSEKDQEFLTPMQMDSLVSKRQLYTLRTHTKASKLVSLAFMLPIKYSVDFIVLEHGLVISFVRKNIIYF